MPQIVYFCLGQVQHAPAPSPFGGLCALVGLFVLLGGLLYGVLWLWMLTHCLLHEPKKGLWIWLLIVAPFPGAIVYAIVRVVPKRNGQALAWLRRFTRRKELARLEAAAHQIGNAHQFIQWGDALRDTGQWTAAAEAYSRALAKDPKSLPALWGAALVADQLQQFDEVRRFCRQVLDADPNYKFGDVSLVYGRSLLALHETGLARQHFEQHCRRWRHPEAVYLLACRCRDDGDIDTARQHLRELLGEINSSPVAVARKFGRWKSLAQKLLKTLPS